MATNFGNDNDQTADRYYDVAVDASLAISDPYTACVMVRLGPNYAVGTGFGYLMSTEDNVNLPNGLHIYNGRNSTAFNKWHHKWEANPTAVLTLSNIDDSVWRVIAATGSTANGLRIRICDVGDDTVSSHTGGVWGSAGSTPPKFYVGSRGDRNTDRYFRGQCAWVFQADYELADSDIVALANGANPYTSRNAWSMRLLLDLTNNDNVTDLIGGRTITQNGTGWADYPSPFVLDTKEGGAGGGAKKAKQRWRNVRNKYPRRVVIDGQVYMVRNPLEERNLLQRLLNREVEEINEVPADEPVPEARKRKVRRLEARMEQAEMNMDAWDARLAEWDEEIITLISS